MNKINRFIDLCLIDEYADKDHVNGFSLDIDSLPKSEIQNLLDRCMEEDTHIRDWVLFEMQKLINDRLIEREIETRWDDGYGTNIDHINGEPIIRPRISL